MGSYDEVSGTDQVTIVGGSFSSPYPMGATALINSSGVVANAAANATLSQAAGKTTYLSGFEVTGAGATAGLPVNVSILGVTAATLSYIYSAAAGALVENTPVVVAFAPAVPATSASLNISISCPALGSGNTNNVVTIHGYRI